MPTKTSVNCFDTFGVKMLCTGILFITKTRSVRSDRRENLGTRLEGGVIKKINNNNVLFS